VIGRVCLLALTALLSFPGHGLTAPGDLDTSYGDGGRAVVPGISATGLALDSGGGGVTAGASHATPYPYAAHNRLTLSGHPATGYESGPVKTVLGYYLYPTVGDVAVQADDRIVVGGGVRFPDASRSLTTTCSGICRTGARTRPSATAAG